MAADARRSKGGDAANALSRHRSKAFHVQDFILGLQTEVKFSAVNERIGLCETFQCKEIFYDNVAS
jgi:hypothetical protein